MTADDLDGFGLLGHVPEGVDVPYITREVWVGRDRPDEWLPWVQRLVRMTGLAEWFENEINQNKRKAGRPASLSIEAVLVGLFATAGTRRALAHTEVARYLHYTASDHIRRALGVRPLVPGSPRLNGEQATTQAARDDWAIERRVGRRVQQIVEVVDPSPNMQPRRLVTKDEAKALRRDKTDAELTEAQRKLDYLVQTIISAPWKVMPRDMRRQWKGAKAVDGTGVPLASRSRGAWSKYASFDVDGGWISKAAKQPSGTSSPRAKLRGAGKKGRTAVPGYFALEAHLVIAADDTPGDRQFFPCLPLAVSLDVPGFDPEGNALRLLRALRNGGVAKGNVAGDRLYAWLKPQFHAAVREYAGPLITDFRTDMLGRQGHAQGADQIEGDFYCPMIPDALANATLDFRSGTKTAVELTSYKARIAVREPYLMRAKAAETPDGQRRCSCPAAGSHPLVKCELKPNSLLLQITRQPDGTRADSRLDIIVDPDKLKGGELPTCCSQQTFTLQPEDGVKHRQPERYGTAKHSAIYKNLRNAQEGLHGFAKGDLHEAIAAPAARRKRGLAAQSLYLAINLAVASLRKIVSFMRDARQSQQDRRWYVLRSPRSPENTDLPVGAVGYSDELDKIEDPPPKTR